MTNDRESLFLELEQAIDQAQEQHEPDINRIADLVQVLKKEFGYALTCNNTYHHGEGYDCCN